MRSTRESAVILADHVRSWAEAGRVVGAELMVLEDGELVVHEASGWSDRERGRELEKNSLYRVRSMTKPLVATAIFKLAEAAELDLDDTVARHLPAWDNPRSGAVTLRQLLHQVGGFEQSAWPQPLARYRSLRAAVDAMGEHGPQHPPGSTYRYSDIGSATLGAIIAERTGEPAERILSEWICEPLEMRDSHFHFEVDAPWAARVNSTYRWTVASGRGVGGFERYWDPSRAQVVPFFRAAGGMYCSIRDYARFLELWLGLGEWKGRRLISEASARAALEPGPFGRYGMSWDLPTTARAGQLPWAFGHGGSDGTAALVVPERRLIALYFTQSRGRDLMYCFAMRAGDAFELPGPMPKWTELARETELELVSLDAAQRRAIVGTYEFGGPDKRLEVFEVEGGVLQTWLRGEEVQLVPLSDRRFALGWHRGGAGVELRCDDDVRLVFGLAGGQAELMEIRREEDVLATGTRVCRGSRG
ncbi:putative penicillin-binding protein PbpX [Enhygromyxa salina]|uniref:Putative penicillin-binding protein PbpX n=1 Tax=Enhygromyxa salina TaxID=215803 RepID=A0A2S9XSN9_9BACT|nr:serine hydrolase domain-containing protein [Enhygromyxa salina]PRP95873.1 putative penicillin-binding protein PbpX [Enhygromyxa salina]